MKYLCAMAALLIALQPMSGLARGGFGGGGFRGGGGGFRGGGGGFNFSHDVPRAPAQRPQNVNHANFGGNNYNHNNVNHNNVNHNNINRSNVSGNNYNRNNYNRNNYNGNRTNVNVSGNTVVRNPVYANNTAWGWNHGVAWYPAGGYWGGGFWGAFAIGVTSAAVGAAVYGSIVANNVTYTSYQVAPNSPGATFLSSYHLTQVQCGPSGLVVVYGPQNSVICAQPNDVVAAGSYQLNTQTLTLSSM